MKKIILRFITIDNVEVYTIKRGKLSLEKRINSKECVKFKTNKIMLASSHYVSSSLASNALNFRPTKKQFLFSNESVLQINDLVCLPAEYDETLKEWQQTWASRTLLLRIKKLIPSAQYFYPDNFDASLPEHKRTDLSGTKFSNNYKSFQLEESDDKNTKFLLVSSAVVCLAIAPWLPNNFFRDYREVPKYENKLSIIKYFEELAASAKFSGLTKLTFNKSLNTVGAILTSSFTEEQKREIRRYCEVANCIPEINEQQVVLKFKRGP